MSALLPLTASPFVRLKADGIGATAALGRLLKLAATPTFLAMAALTARAGSMPVAGATGLLAQLGGMSAMYLLMALFHSPP